MELYQLRTFDAIAREGHLSRAARALSVSQPAVSAQLKALEEELGIDLFERTPKGMALTEDGATLVSHARRILDAATEMVEDARRLRREPEGTIRIGALSDPAKLRMGAFLAESARNFPGIRVDLRYGASGAIRRDILSGSLDCGFVLGPSEPALERRALLPIRLVVLLPADGSIGADRDWEAIRSMPWIGTRDDCPIQVLGQELFARAGSAPERRYQVDIERAIVEMVGAGLGVGLVREDSAEESVRSGRTMVWAGDSIETEIAFVWRRSGVGEAMAAAVHSILDGIWGTQGD